MIGANLFLVGQIMLEPVNIVITLLNVLIANEIPEQWQRCIDAIDNELVQRPVQAHQTLLPGATVNNQLSDQTVVVRWDGITLVNARIDPDTQPARWVIISDAAR